jgi:spore germination cell wall hydrolase CwlJ-like protein
MRLLKILCLVALATLTQISYAYSFQDVKCLADNAYYESRGEGIKGMQAVMDVTLNRKESGKFGNTICKVVYQKNQFAWTSKKLPETTKKERDEQYVLAEYIAKDMLLGVGRGLTNHAIYYHEKSIKPKWVYNMKRVKKIDNHIFYRAENV